MSRRPLDFVLPGAMLSLRDRGRGLPTLGVWIGLLALAVARGDRIVATLTGGGLDDWLALATLLTGLVIAWRAGQAGDAGAHDLGAEIGPDTRTETQWGLAWRAFRQHRPAVIGLVLVVLLAGAALLTPYLAPFDPATQGTDIVATRFQGPTLEHLMGTDRFGRDVLSRVLYGGRISLAIGFLAVVIAITLGTMVGAVAGYIRGWVDSISMRIVDMLLSFPRLVLLITVVALIEPSILIITIVLGLTGWMGTSRVVRGEVLSVREREFVVAARALGFGRGRILLRHILPNVVSPIIVAATLGIGNTILAEAALSFLGLGVPPPAPSWGGMVAAGRDVMLDAWWITLFPGLAIVFTVMAFNLIGDGLRDALDPRTIVGTDS